MFDINEFADNLDLDESFGDTTADTSEGYNLSDDELIQTFTENA